MTLTRYFHPSSLLLVAAAFCLAGCGSESKAKLPFGAFDTPAEGVTVKEPTVALGWALAEDGVDKVALYIDRTFVEYGKLSGTRADVVRVYPDFAKEPDLSWSIPFDPGALTPGRHDVLVRAISKKGAIRDLGSHVINVVH